MQKLWETLWQKYNLTSPLVTVLFWDGICKVGDFRNDYFSQEVNCVYDKLWIYWLPFSKNNPWLKFPPHICFNTILRQNWHVTRNIYTVHQHLPTEETHHKLDRVPNKKYNARPSLWCTLLHYSQHYFIWSWHNGQTSEAGDAKHLFFQGIAWQKVLWLIMSPKKAN